MRIGFLSNLLLSITVLTVLVSCQGIETNSLFDGKTFNGWEGDTTNIWRIVDGAIVGGSLTDTVPHNDFLCTTSSYQNFVLKLKFKLEGSEGFINAGIQFRSQRLKDPEYEMIGYQADIGDGYWGALYDESRRKVVLAAPDSLGTRAIVKVGEWNDYTIRAKDKHIQLFLNNEQTVNYTEPDSTIPQNGLIGLQIHGAGKALVFYRDITIQQLD
jgi:hypothetical protein